MRNVATWLVPLALVMGCSAPAPGAVADTAADKTPAAATAADTTPAAAGAAAAMPATTPSPTTPTATAPAAATGRVEPSLARLSGRVAYPSEYLPPMRVCALAEHDPGTAHCFSTAENQPHYGISVPAGRWRLLAWPLETGTAGDPGLLSQASECLGTGGLDCDDHALRSVEVAAGEHLDGLDINDWYYDPGEFPPPMPPQGGDQ